MYTLPQIDWFTFFAPNQPTYFGVGTASEADRYQDLLNRSRALDCYAVRRATEEEIARIDFTDEGFALDEEIRYLEDRLIALFPI